VSFHCRSGERILAEVAGDRSLEVILLAGTLSLMIYESKNAEGVDATALFEFARNFDSTHCIHNLLT